MIAAGQSVGNYRILSKIGTGGMGAVYLAEHPLIGKKIALKVIHRELAGNKEVVQRFFQEARAVNKIGNEHIVEIHDFGVTPEGDHFYIMEYLDGQTLASVIGREKRLEVMRALHIGAQMASALSAAHVAGVIHRDLKPDNIMLMTRLGDPDFVKVLDFGLAKMFAASGASAVQTAIGVLLGTPQYMSPEACESKRDVDHRTDIYALGVLLFQMMTGVLPFDGESMGEVLVKQVTALPPVPRALNPEIAPSVEQILLRCLAKHPDARFATMMELREALLDPERYLRGSPPIAPARSVAPGEAGVNARQVVAAAEQRTRLGNMPLPATGGNDRTLVADGSQPMPMVGKSRPMPVPALVQPHEPKMNTMQIATPHGYSSRPPRKVWPIVLVFGLLLGLGGGAFAVAWFGRDDAPAVASDDGSDTGSDTVAEGSAGSADGSAGAAGATGSGSAGAGSGSDSAVAGSGSAAAGSGSAGSGTGSGSAGSGSAGSGSGSAGAGSGSGSAGAGSGSGSAVAGSGSGSGSGTGAATPAGKRVKVTLNSRPVGASVYAPDGTLLGRTPLKLPWPTSTVPVAFVLKHRGYRDKTEELTVTTNTMTVVVLERIPATSPNTNPNRNNGSAKPPPGDGLIRPGD